MKTHKNLCQCGSSKFFIEEKLLGSTVIFFDMERREVDYCSMYDSAIHRPAKTKTCVVCLKI